MKEYKECPRCGPKEMILMRDEISVYKCVDCDIIFCSKCSNSMCHTGNSELDDCPKRVKGTRLHSTRKIGFYYTTKFDYTNKQNYLHRKRKREQKHDWNNPRYIWKWWLDI